MATTNEFTQTPSAFMVDGNLINSAIGTPTSASILTGTNCTVSVVTGETIDGSTVSAFKLVASW